MVTKAQVISNYLTNLTDKGRQVIKNIGETKERKYSLYVMINVPMYILVEIMFAYTNNYLLTLLIESYLKI